MRRPVVRNFRIPNETKRPESLLRSGADTAKENKDTFACAGTNREGEAVCVWNRAMGGEGDRNMMLIGDYHLTLAALLVGLTNTVLLVFVLIDKRNK